MKKKEITLLGLFGKKLIKMNDLLELFRDGFFIKKLEKYVEIEREVKRSKSRLYLSERVLADLVSMKK